MTTMREFIAQAFEWADDTEAAEVKRVYQDLAFCACRIED